MNDPTNRNLANKLYKSYSDASQLCGGGGYSMDELAEVVVKKNVAFRESLNPEDFFDNVVSRTLVGIGFAMNSKSLRVLDFGGGGGYHYTLAKSVLGSDCEIRWNIVETDPMCRAAKSIEDDSLKFFNNVFKSLFDIPDSQHNL